MSPEVFLSVAHYTHSVAPHQRRVTVVASGVLQQSDFKKLIESPRQDPAFDETFDILYDFTALSNIAVSPLQAYQLARVDFDAPKGLRVVVAPKDVVYGVCRAISAYLPPEEAARFLIFRSLPEALQHLDTTSAHQDAEVLHL